MKVYVLPADAFGCGHYRLIWPANVLQKSGFDVTIMPPHEKSGFLAKVGEKADGGQELISISIPDDADVIVLQRPAHPLQPDMIRMMRANGIAVIVDMDDDMSSIHPRNIAYETYRPRSHTLFSWNHTKTCCKEATLVTSTTKALQRVYAPHGRGVVLDNYVPAVYLDYEKPEAGTFGWAGTTKSHPDDLQVCGNSVQQLIDDGFRFTVVGGESNVRACLRLRDQVDTPGSFPLDLYAKKVAEYIDVGMCPLSPSAFNTSKSRLKAIEFMALGIPWVGSPREEYRRLSRETGCGLLVDTPKEWHQQLKTLMTDDVLRKEQAERGKEYMTTQTYQANAWRWAEAWELAYRMEHP